jgi:hypothetical protein
MDHPKPLLLLLRLRLFLLQPSRQLLWILLNNRLRRLNILLTIRLDAGSWEGM